MSNVERNKELLRLTSEYGERWMWDDVDTDDIVNNDNGPQLVELGVTAIESVSNYGGEGQGETYYNIFKFTFAEDDEVYIQFDGWYASYNGAEYQEAFLVEPRQVTVTRYIQLN